MQFYFEAWWLCSVRCSATPSRNHAPPRSFSLQSVNRRPFVKDSIVVYSALKPGLQCYSLDCSLLDCWLARHPRSLQAAVALMQSFASSEETTIRAFRLIALYCALCGCVAGGLHVVCRWLCAPVLITTHFMHHQSCASCAAAAPPAIRGRWFTSLCVSLRACRPLDLCCSVLKKMEASSFYLGGPWGNC